MRTGAALLLIALAVMAPTMFASHVPTPAALLSDAPQAQALHSAAPRERGAVERRNPRAALS